MANLFGNLMKATSNAFLTSFKEIDFDKEFTEMRQSMAKASKRLYSETKKLANHIQNYFDKWVVDVDFNQETDTIKSQIKEGSLTVVVSNEANDSERTFSTTIPSDVIIESLVQKYDAKNKKALFIFTKKDVPTEAKEA